jgi:hypothetical protein
MRVILMRIALCVESTLWLKKRLDVNEVKMEVGVQRYVFCI